MMSMFIDDELDLDEKIEFVQTVHADSTVKEEILNLLQQEKLIRSPGIHRVPVVEIGFHPQRVLKFWRPAALFLSGLAAALVIFFFALPKQEIAIVPYRFVIYQPDANEIAITGSFTGWDTIPMKKLGTSGYWELTLDLTQGEHRFGYILGSGERIPDPSILTREKDDFGGENSILDLDIRV